MHSMKRLIKKDAKKSKSREVSHDATVPLCDTGPLDKFKLPVNSDELGATCSASYFLQRAKMQTMFLFLVGHFWKISIFSLHIKNVFHLILDLQKSPTLQNFCTPPCERFQEISRKSVIYVHPSINWNAGNWEFEQRQNEKVTLVLTCINLWASSLGVKKKCKKSFLGMNNLIIWNLLEQKNTAFH